MCRCTPMEVTRTAREDLTWAPSVSTARRSPPCRGPWPGTSRSRASGCAAGSWPPSPGSSSSSHSPSPSVSASRWVLEGGTWGLERLCVIYDCRHNKLLATSCEQILVWDHPPTHQFCDQNFIFLYNRKLKGSEGLNVFMVAGKWVEF